ncbi:TPA: hypothetical protein ACU1ZT_002658 [Staphylococcus aureus]
MIVTNIEYLTLKRTHEELTVNDEGFDIVKIKSFDSTPPVLDGLVNILFTVYAHKTKVNDKSVLCFVKVSHTTNNAIRFDGMSSHYLKTEQDTYSFEVSSPLPFDEVLKTVGKLYFIPEFDFSNYPPHPIDFINLYEEYKILELDIPPCTFNGGLLTDEC